MNAVVVVPAENTAELLKKAQRLHESEHNRLPYIEKYKSIREAVAEFGRL
jgi:4-hydroxy-4-methyl-2-oxoglutarate aldolase